MAASRWKNPARAQALLEARLVRLVRRLKLPQTIGDPDPPGWVRRKPSFQYCAIQVPDPHRGVLIWVPSCYEETLTRTDVFLSKFAQQEQAIATQAPLPLIGGRAILEEED